MPRRTRQGWISSTFSPRRRPGNHARSIGRSLRFEPLEERQLLTITVNTLVDENDGSGVGGISLREALNSAAVGETINFSVTGTINLTNAGSHLRINKSVTIEGPGAGLLTIKAFDPDGSGTNDSDGRRVFSIDDNDDGSDPGSLIEVFISGLTLINGDPQGSDGDTIAGGAIFNLENLTLHGCVISGNHAPNGGGVYSRFGTLTVNDSTISGNDSEDGGGLLLEGSSATINRSTFHDNYAGNEGGGIFNRNGMLTFVDSTISGNGADLFGGGIGSYYGNLSVMNSTISGNSANLEGGGIHGREAQVVLAHSTITGNSVVSPGAIGGGLRSDGATTHLDHAIVAGNFFGGSRSDVSGSFTAEFSLVGDRGSTTVNNQGGSLIGSPGSPINAMLGPLANNGGPTMTHALLSGSPAIDAGDAAAMAGVGDVPQFDQRGGGFHRILDGDNIDGARIDFGAIEAPAPGPALPGDYNLNGAVDSADYSMWQDNFGAPVPAFTSADGDGNGVIEQADYVLWKTNFGNTLPIPAAAAGASAGEALSKLIASHVLQDEHLFAGDDEPTALPATIDRLPVSVTRSSEPAHTMPHGGADFNSNAMVARLLALESLYGRVATDHTNRDAFSPTQEGDFTDASARFDDMLAGAINESLRVAWSSLS